MLCVIYSLGVSIILIAIWYAAVTGWWRTHTCNFSKNYHPQFLSNHGSYGRSDLSVVSLVVTASFFMVTEVWQPYTGCLDYSWLEGMWDSLSPVPRDLPGSVIRLCIHVQWNAGQVVTESFVGVLTYTHNAYQSHYVSTSVKLQSLPSVLLPSLKSILPRRILS